MAPSFIVKRPAPAPQTDILAAQLARAAGRRPEDFIPIAPTQPTILPGMDFNDMAGSLNNSRASITSQMQSLAERMQTKPDMTYEQKIALALLAAAPGLIGGAIDGNRGAAIGFNVGGQGAFSAGQNIIAEQEREQQAGKVAYDSLQKQLQDITQRGQAMALSKIQMDTADARADKQIAAADSRAAMQINAANQRADNSLDFQREKEDNKQEQLSAPARPELAESYRKMFGLPPEAPVTNRDLEVGTKIADKQRLMADSQLRREKARQAMAGFIPPELEPKEYNDYDMPQGVSPEKVEQYRTKREAALVIDRAMRELRSSIEQNGEIVVGGKEFQNRIVQMGALLRAYKDKFGGGAAYTQLEATMANMAAPQLYSNPFVSPSQILANQGLGRNATDLIDFSRQQLRSELGNTADAAGVKFRKDVDPFAIDEQNELSNRALTTGGNKVTPMNIGGLEFNIVD